MEGHSYVSCIKINGVPVLPPMVTKDMRKELYSYKESAINIEKKLAALHTAKKCNANLYIQNFEIEPTNIHCTKKVHCLKGTLDPLKYRNNNYIETNVTGLNMIQIETPENSNETVENNLHCSTNVKMRNTREIQGNSDNASVAKTELATASVNTDECICKTSSTVSNATEAMSEIWKPQVPKTLNIIPLTINNTNCREDKEYQESELYKITNTPKLVRQGSYVLDAPSPILLAHMQMELASSTCSPCSEYVPTSCINTISKEWNVSGSAVEWEYETRSKESVPIDSSKSLSAYKGNSYSNSSHAISKSTSLQTKPEPHLTMYPSTRSVDCIQSMLAEEHTGRSNIQTNHYRKHISEPGDGKVQRFQIWKKCKNAMLNGTGKTGGSLENVNEPRNACAGNYLDKKISSNLKTQGSVSKMKSSIASDKLLIVYKKVQEMHKKQMAELMSRQHREQTLLQKEFEKQQLLLLTEIRKTFPELSSALLSENVLSPSFKQTTPSCCNEIRSVEDNMQQNIENVTVSLEQENEVKHFQNDNTKMVLHPLDSIDSNVNPTKYSYSIAVSETETLPNKTKASEAIVEKESMEAQSDVLKNYEEKLRSVGGKRSNVSRELFPLDSSTVHVPILDRRMYETKYVKAANTINAYVRGYLVRRLMQTERVIALKNTYKEALHCMLKLHAEAPLNRSEFNFLHRLQLQCDAASMNIVELFAQSPQKRMQVIEQDRESKQCRIERPASARSYSFATQRTLARKKLKEMEEYQPTSFVRSCLSRSRCKTWTSDIKERFISSNILYHGIKRSTSAGTVRKPWR